MEPYKVTVVLEVEADDEYDAEALVMTEIEQLIESADLPFAVVDSEAIPAIEPEA